MPNRDPRVDTYIEKAADFAKPILLHLRAIVHRAAPEIEEDIKWGVPAFMHKGIVCGMASFKRHCALGFPKERLIFSDEESAAGEAMGQFGRITSVDDLPPDEVMIAYIQKAVRLNAEGVKTPRSTRANERAEAAMPEAFRKALEANPRAHAAFDAFPPSHRREYIEWIADAKREATRDRRIAQAVEWIAEGKQRNWKYVK